MKIPPNPPEPNPYGSGPIPNPNTHTRPSDDPNLTVNQYIQGLENKIKDLKQFLKSHPHDSTIREDLQFLQKILDKLKTLNPKDLVPPDIEDSITQQFGGPINIQFSE